VDDDGVRERRVVERPVEEAAVVLVLVNSGSRDKRPLGLLVWGPGAVELIFFLCSTGRAAELLTCPGWGRWLEAEAEAKVEDSARGGSGPVVAGVPGSLSFLVVCRESAGPSSSTSIMNLRLAMMGEVVLSIWK